MLLKNQGAVRDKYAQIKGTLPEIQKHSRYHDSGPRLTSSRLLAILGGAISEGQGC